MKQLIATIAITGILLAGIATMGHAQFRDTAPTPYRYTGNVVHQDAKTTNFLNNLFQSFDVQMSHSYSMSFTGTGQGMQNINMYTNQLDFFFSPRLTGQLDVAFAHSPFGSNFSNNVGNNFDNQVFIRNARLDYTMGKEGNTRITLQYQQLPQGTGMFGMNPFAYPQYFRN